MCIGSVHSGFILIVCLYTDGTTIDHTNGAGFRANQGPLLNYVLRLLATMHVDITCPVQWIAN